jgi:queuine tRNA-ribosyltransferase
LGYGADVIFCLDDCTHVDDSATEQLLSVGRTIDWARRGKREFQRIVEQKGIEPERRPLLFAVIQGGGSRELRQRCAEELLDIGFDGFGYGGWPLDGQGNLLLDVIAYTRELVPDEFPLHGLGIGHPANVVRCAQVGYGLFDSAMPTRDARHSRLYIFTVNPNRSALRGDWFSYIRIQDKKYIKDAQPVSPFCDCLCCANYSRGYLRHLFKIGDGLYRRLATIHNLRFMNQLMDNLRARMGE